MDKGFTLPQIIALIFLVLIGILVIFIVKNMAPKKEMPYINYQHDDNPEIILNGSFLEYVPFLSAKAASANSGTIASLGK